MSLSKLTAHRPTSTVAEVFSTPDARGVFHVHLSGWDERRELSVIPPPPSLACFAEGDEGIPFPLAPIEFRVAHRPSVFLLETRECQQTPGDQNLPGLRCSIS
ncbi:hypothetical protein B5X24_HaOG204808 [Helicoverpa armigera]|uniref:Uncharacterized protein n=1 Tax=Helicoverpa armigera TaxID=29058 RepID=A0A2W1BUH2_HELAM|nr:hypothetical protein B5X24_HaOG204808 [Helicoverpa armigera]